ncbi:hypothetical protein K1720_06425 [Thermococcus argininiproducens]|uniref:Uncharacterized protein n=1 Tax=Thermococcus argininiproducens TaxID=2866384 RepID=A0A9E7M8R3_9EURY|nr:hypothetical protein [Thermococcus argininiproducens]USG99180.1 hypothetical protein K1720_06425 [Thermococcus argininiproducens]
MKKRYLFFLFPVLFLLLYFLISESIDIVEVSGSMNTSFDYPLGGEWNVNDEVFNYTPKWFTPPVEISVHIISDPLICGENSYCSFFEFKDSKGNVIGTHVADDVMWIGYFYFKEGFIVYSGDTDGIEATAFSYDLKVKYWKRIYEKYLDYTLLTLLASYADKNYAFFFTASRHLHTNEVTHFCLYYIDFSTGSLGKICDINSHSLIGATIFQDKIYIATPDGLFLYTKSGNCKEWIKVKLSKGVFMYANEKYIAVAYESTVCVFTSELSGKRCVDVGEDINALKLEGEYLIIRTDNRTKKFHIVQRGFFNE